MGLGLANPNRKPNPNLVHEVVARALRDLGVGGAHPFLDLLLDLVRVGVRVRVSIRVRVSVRFRFSIWSGLGRCACSVARHGAHLRTEPLQLHADRDAHMQPAAVVGDLLDPLRAIHRDPVRQDGELGRIPVGMPAQRRRAPTIKHLVTVGAGCGCGRWEVRREAAHCSSKASG